MAQIEERKGIGRKIMITVLVVFTCIYLVPLFYIVNTAFRPWAQIKEYPPKLIFKPSIGSFIRIFTARSVYPPGQQPTEEEIANMKWYERLVYEETNEEVVRAGDLPKRYLNSLIICISSTLLTIVLGTLSAYGFSRFKIKGKDDLVRVKV